MVESELSYEQIRQNRVEDNKKRMEDLNLNKLARSLRVSSSPKPSPAKPRTLRIPVNFVEVRRSTRAKNTPLSYRELGLEPLGRPRRASQRRDLLSRVYASDEGRMYAIDRAEMLQSSLEQEFPSFIKPMLQSHVTGGFWLGLPLHFCKAHLPKRDEMITLIDEKDEEFETKYLAQKNGLSGGWRGFAIDHQLVDGDALVFHLITPTTFKVYIIRVNDDGNNDSDEGEEDKENDTETNKKKEESDSESNKKQEEKVSEASQMRNSGNSAKRKRRGRK